VVQNCGRIAFPLNQQWRICFGKKGTNGPSSRNCGLSLRLKPWTPPGEILSDELAELSLSVMRFARQIKVPHNRISDQGKPADNVVNGFEAGPLVWHQPTVLAEFAEPVYLVAGGSGGRKKKCGNCADKRAA
jgi:hypothetical protein